MLETQKPYTALAWQGKVKRLHGKKLIAFAKRSQNLICQEQLRFKFEIQTAKISASTTNYKNDSKCVIGKRKERTKRKQLYDNETCKEFLKEGAFSIDKRIKERAPPPPPPLILTCLFHHNCNYLQLSNLQQYPGTLSQVFCR